MYGLPPCGGSGTGCWSSSAKYRQLYYSQFNIFKPYVPPFISTINTTDPLYQMYMFTTQYACTNQDIQQAGLQTQLSADIASAFRRMDYGVQIQDYVQRMYI